MRRSALEPSRWEHGSDFHLSLESGSLDAPWQARPHALWGCGRDALRALLAWGRDRHGWSRLLAPTFFCQDVLASVAHELPIVLYEDAPDAPAPAHVDADRSDVLLLTNFFGMRRAARVDTPAVLIEDHTHDPLSAWASASRADYAFASLRKTLPLPDGGVVWSPTDRPLPDEHGPTADHLRVTLDRLSAMALKLQYLSGSAIDKADVRAQFIAGEQAIGTGEASGISPFSRARLGTLPARRWRNARARNLQAFRHSIGEVSGVRLLDAPFAVTLLFDSHDLRERVRMALIAERVYPAVLWALESPVVAGIPAQHVALSRRLLTLHCDFRYTAADMARVAQLVRAITLGSASSVNPAGGTTESSRSHPSGPPADA